MDFTTYYNILCSRIDNINIDLYVSEISYFISYYKYYQNLNRYLYTVMQKAICRYIIMLKYAPGKDVCYCNEAYYLIGIIGTPFNFTEVDIKNLILYCLKITNICCSAFKCIKTLGLYHLPTLRLEGFQY